MFSKGFTLIELLIVVAIIGIIASIIVVTLSNPAGRAIAKKHHFNTAQTTVLIEQYRSLGYDQDTAATAVHKADFTNAEKVIGSFEYLLDISENSNNCHNARTKVGKFLSTIVNGTIQYKKTAANYTDIAVSNFQPDDVYCVQKTGSKRFAVYVQVNKGDNTVWFCGTQKLSGPAVTGYYTVKSHQNKNRLYSDCTERNNSNTDAWLDDPSANY